MKYSLRSLMIFLLVVPPVLACLYFYLKPFSPTDIAARVGILCWIFVFVFWAAHALPALESDP